MRPLLESVKTTVVGGLLVLLPAYLAIVLMLRIVHVVVQVLTPITHHLPGGPALAGAAAVVVVLATCFVTGVVIRTRLGRRMTDAIEQRVLERVPGYTLMRSISRRLGGEEDGVSFAVALVEIEEALVPAFLIEEHPDGSFTVFVPSVPTPAAGSLYILTKERVHQVDVPPATALRCITQWGSGAGVLLQAMRRAEQKA